MRKRKQLKEDISNYKEYLVSFEDGTTDEVEAESEEMACGMAIAQRVFAKADRNYLGEGNSKNRDYFKDTRIISIRGGDLV